MSRAGALAARWGETAASSAVAAALLWSGVRAGVAGAWLGWLVMLLGLGATGWALAAFARARLASGPRAPGVVETAEGRVAYLGPDTGGVAALGEILAVEAARDGEGRPVWRFRTVDGRFDAPTGAAGAERLPDTLAALPGFSVETAAGAFASLADRPVPIWRRGVSR
jgi:hypothetical protein